VNDRKPKAGDRMPAVRNPGSCGFVARGEARPGGHPRGHLGDMRKHLRQVLERAWVSQFVRGVAIECFTSLSLLSPLVGPVRLKSHPGAGVVRPWSGKTNKRVIH